MPHSIAELTVLLGCIDLTSLNEDESLGHLDRLCRMACESPQAPASLCVYPEFVIYVRQRLDALGGQAIKVASVANFPDGSDNALRAARECHRLMAAGADEIDLVLPYRALLDGQRARYVAVAKACRDAAQDRVLKMILETGELGSDERIAEAALLAIESGADLIKTSTGKVPVNATLSAASVMLEAIQRCGQTCGFKASGGIREVSQALEYLNLARTQLGEAAIRSGNFRIGASGLFPAVLAALKDAQVSVPSTETRVDPCSSVSEAKGVNVVDEVVQERSEKCLPLR